MIDFFQVLPQVLFSRYETKSTRTRYGRLTKGYAMLYEWYYITHRLTVLMVAGVRGETAAFSCIGWVIRGGVPPGWS